MVLGVFLKCFRTNFANNENSGRFDLDYGSFPTFHFNVNDEKLIKEVNIEIEKLLNEIGYYNYKGTKPHKPNTYADCNFQNY